MLLSGTCNCSTTPSLRTITMRTKLPAPHPTYASAWRRDAIRGGTITLGTVGLAKQLGEARAGLQTRPDSTNRPGMDPIALLPEVMGRIGKPVCGSR